MALFCNFINSELHYRSLSSRYCSFSKSPNFSKKISVSSSSSSSSFSLRSISISNQNEDINNKDDVTESNVSKKKKLSEQSSWEAKDSEGKDYLYRLGKDADNMNIAVGARAGVIDDVFAGNFLGRDSDIVFDYRQKVTRSFEYLQGDYYIAPLFMQPNLEDILNIVQRMYEKDGISRDEVVSIVNTFPNQALDFYGALRSRTYDRSILKWIDDIGGIENLGNGLLKRRKDAKLPVFTPPKQTLEALLESGYSLQKEQKLIMETKLSKEYMKNIDD